MSRRHTLTSPEQRRLPKNGRTRLAIRGEHVGRILEEGTTRSMYQPAHVVGWFHDDGSFEEADGVDPDKVPHAILNGRVMYQHGASRRLRRSVAHDTRLKNGRQRIEPIASKRSQGAQKKVVA